MALSTCHYENGVRGISIQISGDVSVRDQLLYKKEI